MRPFPSETAEARQDTRQKLTSDSLAAAGAATAHASHGDAAVDHPGEDAFRRLTKLAASIYQAPTSLVTLVSEERVWSHDKSLPEKVAAQIRALCLCHQVVGIGKLFWTEDARLHPLLMDHPLVTGEFSLRFFAAAPLLTPAGQTSGMLCVIDDCPRRLDHFQKANLLYLAELAADELAFRREAARPAETTAILPAPAKRAVSARVLADERERLLATLAAVTEGVITTDLPGNVVLMNPVAADLTGHPAEASLGRPLGDVFSVEEDAPPAPADHADADAADGTPPPSAAPPESARWSTTARPGSGRGTARGGASPGTAPRCTTNAAT